MTLPKHIERCNEPKCCCKCGGMFLLKGFAALMEEEINYKYACSAFADEGIMCPSKTQHGLCELFTKREPV